MPNYQVLPLKRDGSLPEIELNFGADTLSYDYIITLSPDNEMSSRVGKAKSTSRRKNHKFSIGSDLIKLDKDILYVQINVAGDKSKSNYWVELFGVSRKWTI